MIIIPSYITKTKIFLKTGKKGGRQLYILSDVELHVGDWVYDLQSLSHSPLIHRIWKIYKYPNHPDHISYDRHWHLGVYIIFESGNRYLKNNVRKIIYTDNKELKRIL